MVLSDSCHLLRDRSSNVCVGVDSKGGTANIFVLSNDWGDIFLTSFLRSDAMPRTEVHEVNAYFDQLVTESLPK
jgi:hypothetical protein